MKKFEYKIISVRMTNKKSERELNELGEQGWELVSVNESYLYLKREITKQED
jgi:hypothetical protein